MMKILLLLLLLLVVVLSSLCVGHLCFGDEQVVRIFSQTGYWFITGNIALLLFCLVKLYRERIIRAKIVRPFVGKNLLLVGKKN